MAPQHDEEREPDPDLSALIASSLQEYVTRCCAGDLSPHHVEVLKQRTFLHLPGPSARRALSACLARVHRLGHDHLVLLVANRPEGDRDWHLAGFNGGGRYPERAPYAGYSLVIGGSVVAAGMVVQAQNVARLRLTLTSGHVYEDRVGNVDEDRAERDASALMQVRREAALQKAALLLLVPLNEPAQWQDTALVQLLDRGGRTLAEQRLWVSPEPPPAKH